AAQAGIVDEVARQDSVVDGLPDVLTDQPTGLGLPVTLEVPLLDQFAPLPAESPLVPDLGVPGAVASERASLELHVDVAAFQERHLVVDEEVAAGGGFLSRGERVVDLVGQD